MSSPRTLVQNLGKEIEQFRTVTKAQESDFAHDPAALMAAAGLIPDDWQKAVLEATGDALLCVSRQGGKSTVIGVKALHKALYEPYSLILILAPTLRQSQELLRTVTYLHRVTGEIVKTENLSGLRLELANGSRIIVLPGSERTVRGYSGVDMLIIDEAARVEDDLFYTVRPMLAVSGGQMIGLSTPWGRRGWFFFAWSEGGTEWTRTKVDAYECPRISKDFLEAEKRVMPAAWFASEYLCVFGETVDSVFRPEDIAAAFDEDVEPLFGLAMEDRQMEVAA